MMFRAHYANKTTLDIDAPDAEAARKHAERFVKGFAVTKLKRLKENRACPSNSLASSQKARYP